MVPNGTIPFEACHPPSVDVEMIADTAKTFRVKFADLSGGAPRSNVNPREILGIEWAFTWPGPEYDVDLTLDDVKLVHIP